MSLTNVSPVIRFQHSRAGAVAGVVLAGVVPAAALTMFMDLFPILVCLLPVCGLSILVVAARSLWLRTDVTVRGLTIRGSLSARCVPWADVADLEHTSSGRVRARLTSGRAVTLPVVRPMDLRQLRAVAAGSLTAAQPTVMTRGGWTLAMIALACHLAFGLAAWSSEVRRPVPYRVSTDHFTNYTRTAGGWPFLYVYRCVMCSGSGSPRFNLADDAFVPEWFLLDAAILGVVPAAALGAVAHRRRSA